MKSFRASVILVVRGFPAAAYATPTFARPVKSCPFDNASWRSFSRAPRVVAPCKAVAMSALTEVSEVFSAVLALLALTQGAHALALASNCYGFPDRHFSPSNYVSRLGLGVDTGMTAPDFTLNDLNGASHSLSSFQGKPTLIQFGSWT